MLRPALAVILLAGLAEFKSKKGELSDKRAGRGQSLLLRGGQTEAGLGQWDNFINWFSHHFQSPSTTQM